VDVECVAQVITTGLSCVSLVTGVYLPPPMPSVLMPVPEASSHPEWQYVFFFVLFFSEVTYINILVSMQLHINKQKK